MIVALCAGLMLTPLLVLAAWPEESGQIWSFVATALTLGVAGIVVWHRLKPEGNAVLSAQEGGVIVLLSWLTVCLASSIPLMCAAQLSFTQAIFEAVSGWTTTGLSVVNVTESSHVVLMWRSVMQLAGGAGLAIIMLSAIVGPTGPALSLAEGREQLVPHVRRSANLVITIYSVYAVGGSVAYRLAGMDWFDAVNHAFCAVSTGGFSTKPASIGHWSSISIEAVSIPLMFLGNLSFVTAWMIIRGKRRAATRSGELRIFFLLLPVCAALVFFVTTSTLYPTLDKSARVAVFETVSALTTTGFSTVGYVDWNSFGWLVLIVLMLSGGGTCSTAGGIKQFRVYMLAKSLWWELRRSLLPRTAVVEMPMWEAERRVFVDDACIRRIAAFVFLYLFTVAAGAAVMAGHGFEFKESVFEFVSTVGTVGLSVGVTSDSTPALVLWCQIVGMLLGRLEFFVIFIAAAKLFLDARHMLAFRLQTNSATDGGAKMDEADGALTVACVSPQEPV